MKAKTVLVHINNSVYIFAEVAIDVERVVQNSYSLPVGSKSLKKYLRRCVCFSKVACWRPETLLKLTSFTGNLKGLCPQLHRTAANFRKAFWRTLFLQNTSRWLFLSFKSFTNVLRVFQLYFDIPLHSKCQALRAVFSHAEKDSPRNLCLYLTAKK